MRQVASVCVLAVLLACDRSIEPRHSRLDRLRQESTAGVGTFTGRVRERDAFQRCSRRGVPVSGVVVELGLWQGSPAHYRDTITRAPPSSPIEPRFEVIASTTTDGTGRFQFAKIPRGVGYAMRATPGAGSGRVLAYGETMYGIPSGGDLDEFPTLCLMRRR